MAARKLGKQKVGAQKTSDVLAKNALRASSNLDHLPESFFCGSLCCQNLSDRPTLISRL